MRSCLVILFIVSVFGCVRNDKIPKGVMSQNEMRKLMWDLMRADVYVADFVMKDSSCNQKTESTILYEELFRLHSTSREAFQKSLSFYESHPDLLKTITDSLRVDEKKAAEYQSVRPQVDTTVRPQVDTTLKKIKMRKKLIEAKK